MSDKNRGSALHLLCLIESKPFQYDNRARAQMQALKSAGASIIVISPGERGDLWYVYEDGIHIYRYRKPSVLGISGHIVEYFITLVMQSALALIALLRHGFDVIEVTNPPDILWLVALPYYWAGKRVVFDFQDPVPELFEARYGLHRKVLMKLVFLMERMSFKTCHHVIANNETSRRIVIQRGQRSAADITIVRNGPDLSNDFAEPKPDPEVRALGEVIVGYLGMMNPQDQLENFIHMANVVYNEFGMKHVRFVMVGSGDAFDDLKALRDSLGLADAIRMTGRLPWSQVTSTLAATDICVQPDFPTAYTKVITMCKLLEYMALGRAVVAFDLPETKVSGGDSVVYVGEYTAKALADAVAALAKDPIRRETLGRKARQRIETELAWEHQVPSFLSVYDELLPGRLTLPGAPDSRGRTPEMAAS